MIYLNHLYKTFEFDVILEKVAAYSNTSMGKDRILHLKPMTNYYQLKDELDHLDEVIKLYIVMIVVLLVVSIISSLH